MPQLLFEVLTEELPVKSIIIAKEFIKNFMSQELLNKRISHSEIIVQATPRRLVLMIYDLAAKQEAITEEIYGPKVEFAYEAGNPSKALLGFMNSKGVSKDQIYHKHIDKKEVIAAKIILEAKLTKDLLPAMLKDLLLQIPFAKRMRWCHSKEAFARPIRFMTALFDKDYLKISFADVVSGNNSYGHRFLSEGKFSINSIEQYLTELENRFVILSEEKRKKIILEEAQKKCASIHAQLALDEETLEIVSNLCEYPFVILGKFDEDFLALPWQILVSEMKTHQKCFAVVDKNNAIMPYFINVAATKPYSEEEFANGNAIVLKARFSDGAFYFEEDQKIGLNNFAKKLDSLVFEKDLGSMQQKIDRMQKISLFLSEKFNLTTQEISNLKRAITLCKADLVSGVVSEFPHLQGVMGSIYAKLQQEEKAVCEAIEQHYWPKFAQDKLPDAKVAAIISIADRLDTLVGIIGKKAKPSGNKDPFGLRRAAIGIIRILISFGISVDLGQLIKESLEAYNKFDEQTKSECEEFIKQRARGMLIEELAHSGAVSFVDAILVLPDSNLLNIFAKAHALSDFKKHHEEEFSNLTQTFKRASNIVKKAHAEGLFDEQNSNLAKLVMPEEQKLLELINNTRNFVDYKNLFSSIVLIRPVLDEFFLKHMVMVDDKDLRNARLCLLNQIKLIAESFADFTHI